MTQSAYWQRIAEQAQREDRPFFSLAPMEAVTGSVFRRVVMRAAAPMFLHRVYQRTQHHAPESQVYDQGTALH